MKRIAIFVTVTVVALLVSLMTGCTDSFAAKSLPQAEDPIVGPSLKAKMKPSGETLNIAKSTDNKSKATDKKVYLTFDDGPSKYTDEVLDILKREKVMATFFVLGKEAKRSPEIIQRIAEAGHVIGNHTFDHRYEDLYSGFTRFWSQIKETEEVIREITGQRPQLVRAPGGTYGHFGETDFKLMKQAGYTVFDWNVDSGDSKRRGVPASEIVNNVTSAKLTNEMIVLMHDGAGHKETVTALPKIIRFYKQHGYSFEVLSPEQEPVQFSVSSSMKKHPRPSPSPAWIAQHVAVNATLFAKERPLLLDIGGVEVRLGPGEYELKDGQYQIPIRTVMERLGAKVTWDRSSKSATIIWGDVRIRLDSVKGTIMSSQGYTQAHISPVEITHSRSALWIPLRSLIESTGHSVAKVTLTDKVQSIKVK